YSGGSLGRGTGLGGNAGGSPSSAQRGWDGQRDAGKGGGSTGYGGPQGQPYQPVGEGKTRITYTATVPNESHGTGDLAPHTFEYRGYLKNLRIGTYQQAGIGTYLLMQAEFSGEEGWKSVSAGLFEGRNPTFRLDELTWIPSGGIPTPYPSASGFNPSPSGIGYGPFPGSGPTGSPTGSGNKSSFAGGLSSPSGIGLSAGSLGSAAGLGTGNATGLGTGTTSGSGSSAGTGTGTSSGTGLGSATSAGASPSPGPTSFSNAPSPAPAPNTFSPSPPPVPDGSPNQGDKQAKQPEIKPPPELKQPEPQLNTLDLTKVKQAVEDAICTQSKPDKCIDKAIKRNKGGDGDDDNEIVTISVPTGDCEDGEYKPRTENITVPASLQDAVLNLFEEMAKIRRELCELDIQPSVAIPEHWQVRVGADRPQLVVVFAEDLGGGKVGNVRYATSIPHYRYGPRFKPDFGGYEHGSVWARLILKDNSRIVINGKTKEEAIRQVQILRQFVKPEFDNPNAKPATGTYDEPMKECRVVAIYARYFGKGQKQGQPDWVIDDLMTQP
ncbi:MAG: hypothetical protein SFW36_04085, partial [Leptolyngbyaceae cyanobacterium bins.59]|nr:hypothetical protein [Leptolyngbyaceae cyanobacterium bins.59]